MKHAKLSQLHLDRWAVMLEYQKTIAPFPLVMGEICELWMFKHRRGPVNTLKRLAEHDYVRIRKGKRFSMYLAIEPEDE